MALQRRTSPNRGSMRPVGNYIACQEFLNLFKPELGCLKDFKLEVAFKPEATPVFRKPRTVPYAMLDDLNAAYDVGLWRATKAQQKEQNHPVSRLAHTYEVGAPC